MCVYIYIYIHTYIHWQYLGLWVCYSGCLKGVSESVQVLPNGIEAAMVLSLMMKQRAR